MKKFANYLWVEKEDEVYTIRMTAELQDDVGTLGFVSFTDKDVLEVHDEILNLEASKTVMAILTPLAGRVVEHNIAAINQPTLLNSEKPEENWLVRLTDVSEEAFLALEDA
ncbi:glycine cleavage system protein H [Streptococcus ruminantium]|uniref:Glycine cleavage system protein H n=1 Tax=Streptococcus ruminantium TaxID=1917441 RepID=A0ABU1B1N1_9STRE|nr:glycine cleavage system protein H [Streptococcus ruminantium]MDQ8759656.1 glycine cleavage system protein H [Streptococcus ruminantium]MDQ8764975.1 glycine cleavage system protein H [Streptococcus ruminantium]MDQ8767238.1 glycine cleavage system protein H [Streptococcus ruminantium]MDQ8768787.1 glycine cleavage system protein H [Streptococcus ruminantium]MDQ8774734.1 glycine cleavage system protein H [Streptococcus ruminantium]